MTKLFQGTSPAVGDSAVGTHRNPSINRSPELRARSSR